jgi:hypothetical protein
MVNVGDRGAAVCAGRLMLEDAWIIDIARLRAMTDAVFDHLVAEHGPTIRLPNDYYWHVSHDEQYDMTGQPDANQIGQISEDWQFLESMVADGGMISYGLVWISSILHAIGESHMT